MAADISDRLAESQNCFGVVAWTNRDLAKLLRQINVPATKENIAFIRESYVGRHLEEYMIQHGWALLEQTVT